MNSLTIKNKTRQGLLRFCTIELLEKVFSNVDKNNITLDNNNVCTDVWDITDVVKCGSEDLLDNLKVIYVFCRLGGILKYDGEETAYQSLFRLLQTNEPNIVLLFWINNEANGNMPVYDIGELEVPKIMPRFVCMPLSERAFQIHKWQNGEYVGMKEYYPTRELCEKRADELNKEFEANED